MTSGRMTTVVIVEDHPVFRAGLADACCRATDLEVVAAVGSVAEAQDALGLAPDVVLLDLGLPDGSGLDVLATLRARRSATAVVVLTMNDDGEAVLAAVRAGARGYLLKGSGEKDITDAVRAVAAGRVILDGLPGRVVLDAAASSEQPAATRLGLTEREADILRLVAGGLANPAIATRLGLSPKTVRNVVSVVLAKLGVASRMEAAERARSSGL